MNERIRELAEQAEWRFADKATGEFSEYDNRLEKFAELIVKQCIEISQVGSITESKLKKHFGVE
jgi:hypothetical protein